MLQAFVICGSIAFIGCQWLIYFYAPVEASMGVVQKIFYLHLPLAWWALICFFLVFAGSIAYLRKRAVSADNFCRAFAELGVLLSFLALLSGMVWAKKSWGVWWTWDPRLSATLVMWFIYSGYLIVNTLDLSMESKRKIRAVLGIIAFLDVPLVFLSARLFRSIHPAVIGSRGGGLEAEMWLTVLACVAALGSLIMPIGILRKRQLDLSFKLDYLRLNMDMNNGTE